MKKLFLIPIALALVGCGGGDIATSLSALEVTNQVDITAGVSNPCPGPYQAKTASGTSSDMRNNADGSLYQKMPAGKTNFLAVYGGPTNNIPVVVAIRKSDQACKFGTNTLTWIGAISAGAEFKFRVYWKQTPTNAPATATNIITWLP